VNAPVSLCAFYEQFGFRKVEGPFLDYGAPSVGLTCRARSDCAPLACGRRQRGMLPGVCTFEKR